MHKKIYITSKDLRNIYYTKYKREFVNVFVIWGIMMLVGISLIISFIVNIYPLTIVLIILFLTLTAASVFTILLTNKKINKIKMIDYINKELTYYIEEDKLYVCEEDCIILNFKIQSNQVIGEYKLYYKNNKDFFIVPNERAEK